MGDKLYQNRLFRNGEKEFANLDLKTLVEPFEVIKVLSAEEHAWRKPCRDFVLSRFGHEDPAAITLTEFEFDQYFTAI